MTQAMRQKQPPTKLFSRSFNLVSIACFVSFVGDQLSMIALPWLVLTIADSGWALGLTIALLGTPKALFMLLGGVFIDRFSSKKVLLLSKAGSMACLLVLIALISMENLTMDKLYVLVFFMGLCSAFTTPASAAILPLVVEKSVLDKANAVRLILENLAYIAGPILAGAVIAFNADPMAVAQKSLHGLTLVFSLDALSFLLAITLLLMVSVRTVQLQPQSLLQGLQQGLQHFWQDKPLRSLILYVAAVSLFVTGPVQIGIPILVDKHFHLGADTFGGLMAILSFGMIVGMGLSSTIKARISLGMTVLLADLFSGFLLIVVSYQTNVTMVYALLFAIGLMIGFVQVALITWVQVRIPDEMQGRIMAIVQFSVLGVAPLAAILGGSLLQLITITQLFIVGGSCLMGLSITAMLFSKIRLISDTAAVTAQ